jgi:hypothetical protein
VESGVNDEEVSNCNVIVDDEEEGDIGDDYSYS